MKEKIYVDRLFADYENTPAIDDFKEEIAGNLKERVNEFISKGLDDEKAFEKATAELGDITAIANEVGKKKRNEAIGQMYINSKVAFTKKTAMGLTVATGLLLLAAGLGLVAFFNEAGNSWVYYISVILLSFACGLYIYFGLTQETAAHYAMTRKRALAYGIVGIISFFGAGLAITLFLSDSLGLAAAVGVKAVFILPAACALIFLLITEPKRQKPWLKAMIDREIERSINFHAEMVNPVKAAKFGVASGGLWILAAAVFVTLGLLNGWQNAWLVFLFAFAVQVFMVSTIFEMKKK